MTRRSDSSPAGAAGGDLRALYQSLSGKGGEPLEPDSEFYVPILQASQERDPILLLGERISLAYSESVNLLTGFRGNGKSTELRRLRKLLSDGGARVFLIDMLGYTLMTKPLELSDFVLSLMAGFAAQVEAETGLQPAARSYFERLGNFLRSDVELGDLELGAEGAGLSASLGLRLRTDPTFKVRLQQHLRGRLTRVVEDARQFVSDVVDAIRTRDEDPNRKVVLLVDSVEQLRGVGEEASKVHQSVVDLFSGQAVNLAFPKLHVVYTIPPYLIPLAQNPGRNLGGHPVTAWPNVHVRTRDGAPDDDGLRVMETMVEKRHRQWRQVMTQAQLHRLASTSGGDIRDYFRLVRETAIALLGARRVRADAVVDDEILGRVEQQLRNEFLPVSEEDLQWIALIHKTKEASLPSTKDLPDLARYFDGNVIMNYLNGETWYDVHPVLVGELRRRRPAERRNSSRRRRKSR